MEQTPYVDGNGQRWVDGKQPLESSDNNGSNWNTTDYVCAKVENIMWNTDRKFKNYCR